MRITIEVYHVPDVDESEEAVMLYKNANKNLNIKEEDIPKTPIKDLVNAITKDTFFKDKICEKDKVYRPNVSKKFLYDALKVHFKPPQDFRMTTADIVLQIKRINNRLRMKPDTELFSKTTSQIQKEKTRKLQIYLNTERFPPQVWIPYIYNGEDI
jgi:hypothetical protein